MMSGGSSSAAVRVDKATSDFLISPDWTLNMEICDTINASQWQAKDVIKAVKKRLQHKNPRVQFYTLILLETLVKNCGDYVHLQVAERDILQDMVKIVKKKTDMQVRDKILSLLDSWQEAFGGPQGKYPQYYWSYMELKRSGIQFPQRSPDAAPIFTPPPTHPVVRPPVGFGMPANSSMGFEATSAAEMGKMSISDLESIKEVMKVFSEMLQAINQNDREAVKDELIVDLLKQCRANQKKLMQLVTSTSDEELLAKSLSLNDDIQYLIAKHDAIASGSPIPATPSELNQKPHLPSEPVTAPTEPDSHEAEKEDDDEFSQLARRKSKGKSVSSQDSPTETGDQEASSARDSAPAAESSPSASNALTLAVSPAPETGNTKEQDMIDLLCITLSPNPSPPPPQPSALETSATPTPVSYGTGPQVPVGQPEGNPYHPQSYPVHSGYMPYSGGYVAPWAQQTMPQPIPQPQYPQYPYSSSYPPPPWATQPSSASGSFPAPVNQQYASQQPAPSSGNTTMNASYQLQQQNSVLLGGNTSLASRSLQQQDSLGSRGGNPEPRPHPASSIGNKPFIPSYRLFEDLVDLKPGDGKSKTGGGSSMSGSPGQSMISGRK